MLLFVSASKKKANYKEDRSSGKTKQKNEDTDKEKDLS